MMVRRDNRGRRGAILRTYILSRALFGQFDDNDLQLDGQSVD